MKKKNKKTNPMLYQKHLLESSQKKELEQVHKSISNKLDIPTENIVIKKVSFFGKLLELIETSFSKILHVAGFLVVILLISFAITILINEQMRTYVFTTFSSIF